jgi:surface carbohydrate biosynthesis protein
MNIALIVDNPLRDQDGLVLLAAKLADRSHRVYLIEMYNQLFDIPSLKPDIVLVNYVRSNNLPLILYYKAMGIRVGVLDTEGAWSENTEVMASDTISRALFGELDFYCFWGNLQYKAAKKYGKFIEDKMYVVGNPRYDFCLPKYREINNVDVFGRDFILINTRFPRSNPRFTRGENDEIRGMVENGFSLEQAEEYLRVDCVAANDFLRTIELLAEDFPRENFVIRPHPFESEERYIDLARNIATKNIFVRQEKTSIEWIARSKMLIHQNCTTAVEALMLDVPVVSIEWSNCNQLLAPIAQRVSFLAKNYEELRNSVRRVNEGFVIQPSCDQAKMLVENFYNFDFDGVSSASGHLVDVLEAIGATKSNAGVPKTLFFKIVRFKYFIFKQVVRLLLGYKWFQRIKLFRREFFAGKKSGKRLNLQRVEEVVGRLTEIGMLKLELVVSLSVSSKRSRLQSGSSVIICPKVNS